MEKATIEQDGERVRVTIPSGYRVSPKGVRILVCGSAGTYDPLDQRSYVEIQCERDE